MYKIAVFVSGRGSNLKAILSTIPKSIKVASVISDKLDCSAFDIADQYNISKYSVSDKSKSGYLHYEELLNVFSNLEIDLIVLAGFLKKIPDSLIDRLSKVPKEDVSKEGIKIAVETIQRLQRYSLLLEAKECME